MAADLIECWIVFCRCRAYVLESPEHLDEPTLEDAWSELGRDKKMTLRLYLIRGINYNGDSDTSPYCNILLSNHDPIEDKDNTLRECTQSPNLYQYYEWKGVQLPGDHTLTIEVALSLQCYSLCLYVSQCAESSFLSHYSATQHIHFSVEAFLFLTSRCVSSGLGQWTHE